MHSFSSVNAWLLITCDTAFYAIILIDHELFSVVILTLPLIQEGHLSFLVKECAQVLVNRLEDFKPA